MVIIQLDFIYCAYIKPSTRAHKQTNRRDGRSKARELLQLTAVSSPAQWYKPHYGRKFSSGTTIVEELLPNKPFPLRSWAANIFSILNSEIGSGLETSCAWNLSPAGEKNAPTGFQFSRKCLLAGCQIFWFLKRSRVCQLGTVHVRVYPGFWNDFPFPSNQLPIQKVLNNSCHRGGKWTHIKLPEPEWELK